MKPTSKGAQVAHPSDRMRRPEFHERTHGRECKVQNRDDVHAIKTLIARQFRSLNWSSGAPADWDTFAADFFPDASLYPAGRPVRRQSVEVFAERMKGLAQTHLRSFQESVLGTEVRVFGNVAVAVAACEMTENDAEVSRGVEMLLLVKNDGKWQIVSQAWDRETTANPISSDLLAHGPE